MALGPRRQGSKRRVRWDGRAAGAGRRLCRRARAWSCQEGRSSSCGTGVASSGGRLMWPSAEGAGGVAVGGGRSGGDQEATGEVEETRKIFLCRAHGRLICGVAHTY